jgi:hypothetical protein
VSAPPDSKGARASSCKKKRIVRPSTPRGHATCGPIDHGKSIPRPLRCAALWSAAPCGGDRCATCAGTAQLPRGAGRGSTLRATSRATTASRFARSKRGTFFRMISARTRSGSGFQPARSKCFANRGSITHQIRKDLLFIKMRAYEIRSGSQLGPFMTFLRRRSSHGTSVRPRPGPIQTRRIYRKLDVSFRTASVS